MQRSADRQKALAAHGALLSDDRLPMTTLDVRDLTSIDGRILVHGEEEASGRSYLMLESTDGQVYHIYLTPEMEELRSQRGLQTNSFIRLRKLSTVRGAVVEIKDMGDSEGILRNKGHLRETAREMIRRGFTLRMVAGMDGSDVIRKPWLTPHSHWNRRRRKNASDAGVEALAAKALCPPLRTRTSSPFFLVEPDGYRSEQSLNTWSGAVLPLIARTTLLIAGGWGWIAIRSRLQENGLHSHGVGESIRPFDTASSAALMKLR